MEGREFSAKANSPFSRAHLETDDLTLQLGASVTTALLGVQEGSRDRANVTDHAMVHIPWSALGYSPSVDSWAGEGRKPRLGGPRLGHPPLCLTADHFEGWICHLESREKQSILLHVFLDETI